MSCRIRLSVFTINEKKYQQTFPAVDIGTYLKRQKYVSPAQCRENIAEKHRGFPEIACLRIGSVRALSAENRLMGT